MTVGTLLHRSVASASSLERCIVVRARIGEQQCCWHLSQSCERWRPFYKVHFSLTFKFHKVTTTPDVWLHKPTDSHRAADSGIYRAVS
jgi:hypothetical protein